MTIGSAGRAEVRFPISTSMPGTARFQIAAEAEDFAGRVSKKFFYFRKRMKLSDRLEDAAEFTFPVFTPATTEAFATYGDMGDETVTFQPIRKPTGVWKVSRNFPFKGF